MSKQPYSSRDFQRRLVESLASKGISLPERRDPKQEWALVRQDPTDGAPGCFFVTHAQNIPKYQKRKGFEVICAGYDRQELTYMARRATKVCGPSYQPKFSVKPGERPTSRAQAPEPEADVYNDPDFGIQTTKSIDDFNKPT